MAKSLVLHCVWVLLCLVLAQAKVIFVAPDETSTPEPEPVSTQAQTRAKARAVFVFGDSLVDSGNNNFLATPARADMPPYGIDYPSHQPTGRFSNGYNIPDLLSLSIGSVPTMPYLHPELQGEKLLVGANFASAGIGILNDTGIQFVSIIRIWQQFQLFEQYKSRLIELIGADKARKLVNDSLVLISLGGNDFVNNYYLLPITLRSRQFELPDYIDHLIKKYRPILMELPYHDSACCWDMPIVYRTAMSDSIHQFGSRVAALGEKKWLYELGPRRIIVMGTGPLGCAPAELALWSPNGECATELQTAADLFNPKLVQMINELNDEIGSHVFIAANAHDIHMDFITNPSTYGFTTSKIACCGQGPFNGLGLCTPLARLCQDRDRYVFWDAYHPTERANRLIVEMIMNGSKKLMHPYNLTTVLHLDSEANY